MNDPHNDDYYLDHEPSPNFKPERNPDDVRDEKIDELIEDEE